MSFLELFLLAVGLSMGAFAVAVCSGLTMPKVNISKTLIIGLYFGMFQNVFFSNRFSKAANSSVLLTNIQMHLKKLLKQK